MTNVIDRRPAVDRYPLLELPKRERVTVTKVTLRRWVSAGVGGVRLRVERIGGRVYTRDEWVADFFERGDRPPAIKVATPRQRERRQRQVDRELEAAGI